MRGKKEAAAIAERLEKLQAEAAGAAASTNDPVAKHAANLAEEACQHGARLNQLIQEA